MTAPKYAACDNSGKFTWSKVYSYNQYNANTFSTKTRSLLIVHCAYALVSKYCSKYYVVCSTRHSDNRDVQFNSEHKSRNANSGLLVYLSFVERGNINTFTPSRPTTVLKEFV